LRQTESLRGSLTSHDLVLPHPNEEMIMHNARAATASFALCLAYALVTGLAMAEEKTGASSGQRLFEFHGCANCHGAGGKEPVSKVVPALAGKPGDELYEKATQILSGDADTEEAKLMHAAVYSAASCNAPPTDAEVKSITAWLATQ
jgi:mono/diheme cytochrome c family protein